MIKTTLQHIMTSHPALAQLVSAKLPAKAAYAVSKLAKACASELAEYNQARTKIFTDAGCAVVETEYVHTDPDILQSAVKQADELLASDVEINALLLDISQFGDAEVPGGVFISLGWALKED